MREARLGLDWVHFFRSRVRRCWVYTLTRQATQSELDGIDSVVGGLTPCGRRGASDERQGMVIANGEGSDYSLRRGVSFRLKSSASQS